MRKLVWCIGLAPLFGMHGAAQGQSVKLADINCDSLLSAAAVKRLTGLSPLRIVRANGVTGAWSQCNYVKNGSTIILQFSVLEAGETAAEEHRRRRSDSDYRLNQKDLSGVGDEAFTGGAKEHLLVARKGSQILRMTAMTWADPWSEWRPIALTREQTIAAARELMENL